MDMTSREETRRDEGCGKLDSELNASSSRTKHLQYHDSGSNNNNNQRVETVSLSF